MQLRNGTRSSTHRELIQKLAALDLNADSYSQARLLPGHPYDPSPVPSVQRIPQSPYDSPDVIALLAAAPRWRVFILAFWRAIVSGLFCTTSSPSVRMSSMWQGLDM